MSIDPLLRHRLACLHLAGPLLDTAADAVDWLVAVQAQDYAAAQWSLGLRLAQGSDTPVERTFNDGAILRPLLLACGGLTNEHSARPLPRNNPCGLASTGYRHCRAQY